MVIEIESIAQAPETLPPFFFFFPVIHPQAFKEKQDALYILVGGRHCTLHTERATKLLFSVSEAYSGLITKRNTQNKQNKKNQEKNNRLESDCKQLRSAEKWMDMTTHTLHGK